MTRLLQSALLGAVTFGSLASRLCGQAASGVMVRTSARSAMPSSSITIRAPKVDFGGVKDGSLYEVDHRNGYLTAVGTAAGGAIALDGDRLLVFDPSGRGTRIIGRKGAGPGEFTALWRGCGFADQGAVVMDNALRRLTWISAVGTVLRSQQVPNMGALLEHGCLDDGAVVYQAPSRRPGPPNTHQLWRLDTNGNAKELPVFVPVDDPTAPVASPIYVAAVRRRILIADSRTNEIAVYSDAGRLLRRIATRDQPPRLSAELIRRNSSADSPDGLAPPTRGAGPNERMPAFADVVISTDGQVLVRDAAKDRVRSNVWTLHDVDGELAARVEMLLEVPHRLFQILQLEETRMFVLWRDMDGTAHFGWVPRPEPLRVRRQAP